MKIPISRLVLFIFVLLISISLAASAQEKTLPEAYSGVAMHSTPPSAKR